MPERLSETSLQEFGGKRFHIVTRIHSVAPHPENISTAHCLAFDDSARIVLALSREAIEEAGAVVDDPLLFAHERIDPEDGVPADPRYPVPSYQVFYVVRLVSLGAPTATEECTESRLFTPAEALEAPGWVQRNMRLYEVALELARARFRA